ncbi:MAG: hypothetical protein JWP64_2187 [Pseudonocardia sp.]|jgi:hypothetical protein|uniref:hypothetical protein n=1 Tax=Pseudonocardia sp. TaxID=60912 RepID=UPI0026041A71|nr:hypothetical protein [Pseudonocardia sp.]MCU1627238.1 hypothetical protein [Pseudonocardia sp.]
MATVDSATTLGAGRSAGAAPPNRSTRGREAAASATAKNVIHIELPGIGHLHLPPLDQVAFLGGIATLALIEVIEWPVAAVLTVGHVLANNRHHALLRSFGEALDEA